MPRSYSYQVLNHDRESGKYCPDTPQQALTMHDPYNPASYLSTVSIVNFINTDTKSSDN